MKNESDKNFSGVNFTTLHFPAGIESYIYNNKIEVVKATLSDTNWTLSNAANQHLCNKINTQGIAIAKLVNKKIYRGILTGLNEAFIINANTRKRLIEKDNNSKRFIKPFLAGKDIKAYIEPTVKQYAIVIPKGFTIKRNLPDGNPMYLQEPTPHYGSMHDSIALAWFKKNYPSIIEHLLPFEEKAIARTDKGDFWWELRACDYYNEFDKIKIVWPETSKDNQFCYVDKSVYLNKTTFFIPGKDNYLLALLNSRLAYFFFNNIVSKVRGGYFSMSKVYIEQFPVKKITVSARKPFINLVDEILAAKKQGKETKTLEDKIDTMVYALYQITPDEQKIIEGG